MPQQMNVAITLGQFLAAVSAQAIAGLTFVQVWLYAPKTLKLVPCSATLLCFPFILHKIDRAKFDPLSWIAFLGNGIGLNVMLFCLWVFDLVEPGCLARCETKPRSAEVGWRL